MRKSRGTKIKHEKRPPRGKDVQLLSSTNQPSTMLNKIALKITCKESAAENREHEP
jgi:hypothetical protein